ncbi:hypothetical protein E0F15_19315 [Frankia sp. B2]|uniref:hypothetical protein n=1 Tax=Frankia TaxID=1854 RepID=UPI000A970519|nr:MULTISPECIES: hypothetical protein [Frankia]TFE25718.1 hypothetical protein E0F15_19315 [Frankia sp. B2]
MTSTTHPIVPRPADRGDSGRLARCMPTLPTRPRNDWIRNDWIRNDWIRNDWVRYDWVRGPSSRPS